MAEIASEICTHSDQKKNESGEQRIVRKEKRKHSLGYRKIDVTLTGEEQSKWK